MVMLFFLFNHVKYSCKSGLNMLSVCMSFGHDVLACDWSGKTGGNSFPTGTHFPAQSFLLELSTHNVQKCIPGTGPSIPQDLRCRAYTSVRHVEFLCASHIFYLFIWTCLLCAIDSDSFVPKNPLRFFVSQHRISYFSAVKSTF